MPTDACYSSKKLIRDTRRLLWAVARTVQNEEENPDAEENSRPLSITEWPTDCPGIALCVECFFPAAILLKDMQWSDQPNILMDGDHRDLSGFVSAFYMAESVRNFLGGRLKKIAGRAYMQPPASVEESEMRFYLMTALGKGVPLMDQDCFRPQMLTSRLNGLDLAAIRGISPAEQMALVTVLAARNGPVAFLSQTGDWPHSIPVHIAAELNNCRIYRFNLDGVPEQSIRRIRHSQYLAREEPN